MSAMLSTIIGFFTSLITIFSLIFGGSGTDAKQPAVMNISPVDAYYKVLQGGCSDGEYVYLIMHNGAKNLASNLAESALLKIDPDNWEIVDTYKGLKVDHANDMCYNAVTNEIIIVSSSPDPHIINIFDADTMQLKQRKELSFGINALAYSEEENCYYACLYGTNTFARLSSDFKKLKTFSVIEHDRIEQNIEVHGDYVYITMYDPNSVLVYNKQGELIEDKKLAVFSNELECAFFVKDTMYVGYYQSALGGAIVYKTDIK